MRYSPMKARWWGPPKKLENTENERRISWLELFYDLVYVIAISRITHHFSLHISIYGFLEYFTLFVLIYWGWLNGSQYYDLHGSQGLRTRLMTLWQMMIIAALAITIDQSPERRIVNITIVLMVMQLYITYLWWSVGFYDRSHRRYSQPFIILYLTALVLMGISLVVPHVWLTLIIPLVLICNYTPHFISSNLFRSDGIEINLSSSMAERLGLFTIIVFGEVVLGVVTGISKTEAQDFNDLFHFALALSIVFALWWLFFTLIGNRKVKPGFVKATLMELLYIPALLSLGLLAVSFFSFFDTQDSLFALQKVFGIAVAAFLATISLMLRLLEFPVVFHSIKRPIRFSLMAAAMLFVVSTFIDFQVDITYYLVGVLSVLLLEIIFLNSRYYGLNIEEGE